MIETTLDEPAAPADDLALLARFPAGGPSYALYPTVERFRPQFGAADALRQLRCRGQSEAIGPLSIHVHLPFCEADCYFCVCDRIVTRGHLRTAEYLSYLEREIVTQRGAIGRDEEVAQLHWGGGTPNFLSIEEMSRLMEILRCYFAFLPGGEHSIEIDPRHLEPGTIEQLATLGFNQMTIGVQECDPVAQAKGNRLQPLEDTARATMTARAAGFRSVGIELIFGLPAQSTQTMARTLDAVLRMCPERIALNHQSHLPAPFASQRSLDPAPLPRVDEESRFMAHATSALGLAGYVHIGMGQFALPDDDLALALDRGTLHRTLQGYSARARGDLLAFGLSGISAVGDLYSQNHRSMADYRASLDRGELPVLRGHRLDTDDILRREVIQQLACRSRLDFEELAGRFGIDVSRYFEHELGRLEELEREGLIERSDSGIKVTPRGRHLVRIVCMAFDRYLREAAGVSSVSGIA